MMDIVEVDPTEVDRAKKAHASALLAFTQRSQHLENAFQLVTLGQRVIACREVIESRNAATKPAPVGADMPAPLLDAIVPPAHASQAVPPNQPAAVTSGSQETVVVDHAQLAYDEAYFAYRQALERYQESIAEEPVTQELRLRSELLSRALHPRPKPERLPPSPSPCLPERQTQLPSGYAGSGNGSVPSAGGRRGHPPKKATKVFRRYW
jgi:hypothetical protein